VFFRKVQLKIPPLINAANILFHLQTLYDKSGLHYESAFFPIVKLITGTTESIQKLETFGQ